MHLNIDRNNKRSTDCGSSKILQQYKAKDIRNIYECNIIARGSSFNNSFRGTVHLVIYCQLPSTDMMNHSTKTFFN